MRAGWSQPRGVAIRLARAGAAICAAWLATAAAADAARVVDVRVGVHPRHTRVVFETDAPAAHQLEVKGADVLVRLVATSPPRTIAARDAGAPSIELEPTPDGGIAARIHAPTPVRVETQVLDAPPRVVLDLHPAPELAVAPEPPPQAPEEPAVAPPPVTPPPVEPLPTPAEQSPPIEPAPAPPSVEAPPLVEPAPAIPAAEPVVVTPIEPAAESELPPVETSPPLTAPIESAPPGPLALDSRSLLTGIALGFALALFAFAARRPRGETLPAPARIDPEPLAPVRGDAADSAPDAESEDRGDVARVVQRLDARLGDATTRLAAIAARQDRLESQAGAQNAELAAQRVAIARLKLALRPAGIAARRERAETNSG